MEKIAQKSDKLRMEKIVEKMEQAVMEKIMMKVDTLTKMSENARKNADAETQARIAEKALAFDTRLEIIENEKQEEHEKKSAMMAQIIRRLEIVEDNVAKRPATLIRLGPDVSK
jgi:hypothetical protein